jgi:hypothetical protein
MFQLIFFFGAMYFAKKSDGHQRQAMGSVGKTAYKYFS